MTASELRRRFRRATHWRSWSRRTQAAVAAWVPVALVTFTLYTGPNRAPAQVLGATTQTVETVPAFPRGGEPTPARPRSVAPALVAKGTPLDVARRIARATNMQLRTLKAIEQRTSTALERSTAPITRAVRRQRTALQRTSAARDRKTIARNHARALLRRH
jgi:hypothetical protein